MEMMGGGRVRGPVGSVTTTYAQDPPSGCEWCSSRGAGAEEHVHLFRGGYHLYCEYQKDQNQPLKTLIQEDLGNRQ